MKKLVSLGLLVSAISTGLYASEGGTIGYPLGIDAMYSGVMLPEGLSTMVNYNYYTADRVNDSSGHQPAAIDYFKVTSHAISPRFDYIWPNTRLLGANVGSRVTFAFPDVDVKNEIHYVGNVGGSAKGLADSTITPIMLGWHSQQLHQTAGLDITVPIGKYNKNNAVNVGRNSSTVAPYYAVTWFDPKWDVSAKAIYAINQKNKDTDYRSGNGVIIESSLGYHVNRQLTAGVTGYYFKQVTDDKQNGQTYSDGYRGQVMGLGPYVAYRLDSGLSLVARGYKEFNAKNHSEGTNIFTGLMYSFK